MITQNTINPLVSALERLKKLWVWLTESEIKIPKLEQPTEDLFFWVNKSYDCVDNEKDDIIKAIAEYGIYLTKIGNQSTFVIAKCGTFEVPQKEGQFNKQSKNITALSVPHLSNKEDERLISFCIKDSHEAVKIKLKLEGKEQFVIIKDNKFIKLHNNDDGVVANNIYRRVVDGPKNSEVMTEISKMPKADEINICFDEMRASISPAKDKEANGVLKINETAGKRRTFTLNYTKNKQIYTICGDIVFIAYL